MEKDAIFHALDEQQIFQNDDHRSRFKELLDCYADASFFTPGLCKCMYLAGWDMEHFCTMLDMLNQLSLGHNMGLHDMYENGELVAEEKKESGSYEDQVMKLSCAFIMNESFSLEDLPQDYDPEGRRIIEAALKAAAIIDEVTKKEN